MTHTFVCWMSFHQNIIILFYLAFINSGSNWWRMQSQRYMKCNNTVVHSHTDRKFKRLQHTCVSIIPVCQHSSSSVCQHTTHEEHTWLVICTSKITRPPVSVSFVCACGLPETWTGFIRHAFLTNIPGKCHMALNKLIVLDRQEQTQPLGVAGFKHPSVT